MTRDFINKCFSSLKNNFSYKDSLLCSYQYEDITFIPVSKYIYEKSLEDDQRESLGKNYFQNDDKVSFLISKNGSSNNLITFEYLGEILNFVSDLFQEKHILSLIEDICLETGQHNFSAPANKELLEHIKKSNKFEFTQDKNLKIEYLGKFEVGKDLILTAGPSISLKEARYAYDAAYSGWNAEWSKYLNNFEQKFAEFIGSKYAIATSSCTGSLQIALMALNIGPGDEVIVPDVTWVATANAVRYTGATPIFCDIELDSWNMDYKSAEKYITQKTKAIMPVHMYGNPARMNGIMKIAEKYKLHVVEDSAPAIGAKYNGKNCGTFGDFGAFSFQGAKLLVTGEGGMLVTDSDDLYTKAKKIWDQGRNPNKTFWIDGNGVKFKMSNVQAAVGLGQLERIDELIAMKRRIFSWYEKGLKDIKGIHLNKEVKESEGIYWMSSIRIDKDFPLGRDKFMTYLRSKGIDTRPVFPPISRYPIWDKTQASKNISTIVGDNSINLPSGVCLTKHEINYICNQIKEVVVK